MCSGPFGLTGLTVIFCFLRYMAWKYRKYKRTLWVNMDKNKSRYKFESVQVDYWQKMCCKKLKEKCIAGLLSFYVFIYL